MSIDLKSRPECLTAFLTGILLFTGGWSLGQTEAGGNPVEPFVISTEQDSAYRVGIGDSLEVNVFGFEQFHKTLRINGDGTIRLPLLEEIAVEGLTTAEIEKKLARLLKEAELFNDPDVNVRVQEFRSQSVFVLGMVGQPGQYHLTRRTRLIEVLSLAGGVRDERAGDTLIIERYREPEAMTSSPRNVEGEVEEAVETITVDLERLLEQGDLSLNYWVRNGDVISVPERLITEFFIIGEVNRPGAFLMNPDENLLLSQALARAGGPMKTASLNKGILARFDSAGVRQEIAIDVEKILKGEEEDFPVMPDDVIFIPGSTFKSIGYGLLGAIPRTVSETIVPGRYR